jgi:hypothetical protein
MALNMFSLALADLVDQFGTANDDAVASLDTSHKQHACAVDLKCSHRGGTEPFG